MARKVLQEKESKYIRDNYLKVSGKQIARDLGLRPDMVYRYMKKNGLVVPKEVLKRFRSEIVSNRTTSTPEIDRILKSEYLTTSMKDMARKVGKSYTFIKCRLSQLGLEIPQEILDKRRTENQFQKGRVSHNKGKKMSHELYEKCRVSMFKKGATPANTKYDGAISVRIHKRTGIPYKYVRIERAKWRLLSQVIWERKNGPLPEKHIIIFKDGNTLNCSLENLECVSMVRNMLQNSKHGYPKEVVPVMETIVKIKQKIRQHEK